MKTKPGQTVLVIAAHPDDEALGCGATVAKHVQGGDRVWILILGEGVTSRRNLPPRLRTSMLGRIRTCARDSSQILGAARLILKKLPDNRFDQIPLLDIVHTIEDVVCACRPTVIYTHYQGDVNIDHRLTAEAVSAVTRPMPDSTVRQVMAFEVPSSTEWNFAFSAGFRPNVFINVEGHLGKKLKAIEAYPTESRQFPHPRSLEYIQALARMRGGQSGMRAAEAFMLVYRREL